MGSDRYGKVTERIKVNRLVIVIEQIADSEAGSAFGIFQDRILRGVLAEKWIRLS
jgi:hypothetical protein